MIALALFRHPVFAAANGAKVGCYLSLMAAMFLAPFYFQRALGLSPYGSRREGAAWPSAAIRLLSATAPVKSIEPDGILAGSEPTPKIFAGR